MTVLTLRLVARNKKINKSKSFQFKTPPPGTEDKEGSMQQVLDTLARLYFMKVLLLDIGLSMCDSITDLIQASRKHSFCFQKNKNKNRFPLSCT